MRIMIITQGSRGDIEPFAALAHELMNRQHEVVFVGPESQLELPSSYGAHCVPTIDPIPHLISRPEVRNAIEQGAHGLYGLRLRQRMLRTCKRALEPMLADISSAARTYAPDVIVHHVKIPGNQVAELLDVPAVPVCLDPSYVPTASFSSPRLQHHAPKFLNKLTYLSGQYLIRNYIANVRSWRNRDLRLRRRIGNRNVFRQPDGSRATVLQAFSQHILERPLDYPDWVHTTGFWYTPSRPWQPPRRLLEFLSGREPTIYVGFGSISGSDPARTGKTILQAIGDAGVRAVVASGWGGILTTGSEKTVHLVDRVPHSWLFQRVGAIVHHGGAGTTGASLAAGRPQVVCPFYADQPFYAARMSRCGVAPNPLPQRNLKPVDLAAAIHKAVTDPQYRTNAAKLARKIREEPGVSRAADIIETIA